VRGTQRDSSLPICAVRREVEPPRLSRQYLHSRLPPLAKLLGGVPAGRAQLQSVTDARKRCGRRGDW